MSRPKQSTPTINENHPAHKLTFVDDQIKQQLLKTPIKLLIEDDNYRTQLQELRNDWKYAFVLQWLFFFRGASRLANETITADLIEEELVGLTEENLMIKIPVSLAATLIGSKVTIDDFSYRVRFLLGDTCNILGTEESPIEFKSLSLTDKFALFYELIQRIQNSENFKNQVEKYENDSELRFDSIFEKNAEESYYLLSDNRIYLRRLTNWPKYKIPRKHKYAKLSNPEEALELIEPELQWECVAIGIYEIHDFLHSIKSNRSMKPLFQNIKDHIDDLANEDLQTRKKILKRKREHQLTQLVSSRKRSSRIQMKEEQQHQERERLAAEAELEKQRQLKARKQRKLKQKENLIKKDIEERLRRTQASSTKTRNSRLSHLRDSTPSAVEVPDKQESTNGEEATEPKQEEMPTAPLRNIDASDLKELEEGEWLFQCECGVYQKNHDDGTKLISCERCNRWQHLKCQPRQVQQELVQNADEPFICNYCKEDFEMDVLAKLEKEEIAKEKEEELRRQDLLKKQRQRELEKVREQEELAMLEDLERLRKEELERERQRRIEERREALTSSSSQNLAGSSDLPVLGIFSATPSAQTTEPEPAGLKSEPIKVDEPQPQPQPQPQQPTVPAPAPATDIEFAQAQQEPTKPEETPKQEQQSETFKDDEHEAQDVSSTQPSASQT